MKLSRSLIAIGAIAALDIVWTAADIFMAVMALINLFALILLSPLVFTLLKNYMDQRRAGQEPIFRRGDLLARLRLGVGRDGVFQVQDQDVGVQAARLVERAGVGARHVQDGTAGTDRGVHGRDSQGWTPPTICTGSVQT